MLKKAYLAEHPSDRRSCIVYAQRARHCIGLGRLE